MNRPKKNYMYSNCPFRNECIEENCNKAQRCAVSAGYDNACDDWEAYLPTEEELACIILDWQENIERKEKKDINILQSDRYKLAKAIHERISK